MKVVIRADASPEKGTGHVMRCIALGEGIVERGGEVVFITHCTSEGLVSRLEKEGFGLYRLEEPESISEALRLVEGHKPDWVVLDGYHFGAEDQKAVKDAGYRLLVIDDSVRLDYYYADIVLNQNYGAEDFPYTVSENARLLLGAPYVMLRKEFLKHERCERNIPPFAQNILITMGGADPENNTLTALQTLRFIEIPLKVTVVVGAANPHYEMLAREVEGSRHRVKVVRGVEDMVPLMAWADAAISAGGSTVWELAYMGVPSLLCIVADNQEKAVNRLVRDGIFMRFSLPSEISESTSAGVVQQFLEDQEKRASMRDREQMVVDGKGVGRILDALILSSPLTILFLGGGISKELAVWLEERGEKVFCTEEKVDARYVSEVRPDMIISYNYRHIITQDVLDIPLRGAVNLHISYLPWNRGAHPNIWSFLEDSPKGVTIHYINEGIDTGDILLQEEVHIDEERETLGSSYGKLHQAIQVLFKRHWDHIRDRRIPARPQPSSGTLHFTKDSTLFEALLSEKAWDTPIKELKEKYRNARLS